MVASRWVLHVKGGNRTEDQDQQTQHLQRQFQRPVKLFQEENFQRSQPQGAQAEAGHHQTVNQAFFGGVEPLHGRCTGAGIHKANTVTNQKCKHDGEQHRAVCKKATQNRTATDHQDAGENHLGRTNFVLNWTCDDHNKSRNEAAICIWPAQLGNIPFLVETVSSINGFGHAACIVDRTVFKDVLEVRPSIKNTDTEVGQHSEQQDAPALALFLSVSHGIRWNSSR